MEHIFDKEFYGSGLREISSSGLVKCADSSIMSGPGWALKLILGATKYRFQVNPRATGVSGRTRRAGVVVNITPLVISGTKHRRETGQAAIESSQHKLSNACL